MRGNTLHDTANQICYVTGASHHILFENNTLTGGGSQGSQNGEGFYIGNGARGDLVNNVTIRGNTITGMRQEGVELKPDTSSCIVENNIISNSVSDRAGNIFGKWSIAVLPTTGALSSSQNHIIRNNRIFNHPGWSTGAAILAQGGGQYYNNVIYNVTSPAFAFEVNGGDNFPKYIWNNTADIPSARWLNTASASTNTGNNIGPPTSGSNLAFNSAFFVNAAGNNYHLVAGSTPATQPGATPPIPIQTDLDEVARGTPPDIGAFELIAQTAVAPTFSPVGGPYTLTVVRGSGSGPYAPGTSVNVRAEPPARGEQFAYWDGDTQILQRPRTDKNNEAFTIERDVTITAIYSALPSFTVTVTSGTGDGSYIAGDTVQVGADAAGSEQFTGWTGNVAFSDALSPTTTFTMPAADVIVTATYRVADEIRAIDNPLLSGLVGYWSMDEASGNRADLSVNGNTLTEWNVAIHGTTGKVDSGANIVRANNSWLDCPSNATLTMSNTSFTIAHWVKFNTVSFSQDIVSKDTGALWDYCTYLYGGDQRLHLYVDLAGGGYYEAIDPTVIVPGAWYFMIGIYDHVNHLLKMSLNNGAFTVTDMTGYTPVVTNGSLKIGAETGGNGRFDGVVDEVGIWKRVLSASEITTLYNSGAGTTYPF